MESFFQIVLILTNIKYRYGFTVKRNLEIINEESNNFSREIVTSEWLYASKSVDMYPLFERTRDKVITNNLKNKNKIPADIPYKHTLFIAHAAAFDRDGECYTVFNYLKGGWIHSSLNIADTETFRRLSVSYIKSIRKTDFLYLLSIFNLKYNDIILQSDSETDKAKIFPQEKIFLKKQYKSIKTLLNLKSNESSGTQKLFDLAGLLLGAFNIKSLFIILDEIDSNFHPSLLIKLIKSFNDRSINQGNAQLLFTSHDTNLMSPSIMRRDQFYFTEKNEDDSTRLYSLADLKGVQNDADFAKQYLAGFYGALPILEEYCQEE
jgi:AAA15 family ATPase/GTPase